LIVAVNSDASVRRLKGAGRPVMGERARCAVLAALASVDVVSPFYEDTPASLIEALRPDVLVKGAEYAFDEIVGATFVSAYGGSVLRVPRDHSISTTETIARIREQRG
jgi:D-beta-D-heptose 7-phosphate kinase/D-beta-D-heptose 1-phosphate adenosyltransferase